MGKNEKKKVSLRIVNAIRSQDPPGRFLEIDSKSSDFSWKEIIESKAIEKTSQALREGEANASKVCKSNSSNGPSRKRPEEMFHSSLIYPSPSTSKTEKIPTTFNCSTILRADKSNTTNLPSKINSEKNNNNSSTSLITSKLNGNIGNIIIMKDNDSNIKPPSIVSPDTEKDEDNNLSDAVGGYNF